MNEVRKIKYTGKNLDDVFHLPCVISIRKYNGQPYLILDRHMIWGFDNIVPPGSELIELTNGEWEICFPEKHEITAEDIIERTDAMAMTDKRVAKGESVWDGTI